MTALAAAFNRQSRGEGRLFNFPMAAVKIYKGALVALNTAGYLTGTSIDTASFVIVGVAEDTIDNSAGNAGDLSMKVRAGCEFLFPATSITQAMVGTSMEAVDSGTIDDTSTTNHIKVGKLVQFVSTTSGWVFVPGLMVAG